MRVIQMVSALLPGDAVGNDALAIQRMLLEQGYETGIYYHLAHKKTAALGKNREHLRLTEQDVLLYHHATGDDICYQMQDFPCRKVMIYHNITPPEFFEGFSKETQRGTQAR